MDWWIVALIGIQVGFVSFLIWVGLSSLQKRKARESEEKLRILETFESGRDFGEFLATEQGRQFLQTFQTPPPSPRILWIMSLYCGLLATFLGSGFLILAQLDLHRKGEDVMVPAVLLLSAGAALLLAGFLTRQPEGS